ncbi:MAG: hypothetical protein LBF51_00455 [Zoogloeaceae bacterium]|jgi:hypothetical protein|nr:hypothetical protein [Zoogloeaceae bacterium]
MPLTWDEIQANAIAFSKRWKAAHNEEAQAQAFVLDLLRVFGADAMSVGDFEYKVPLSSGTTGYMDYLWKKRIAIEMKSKGEDLSKAYRQLQNYLQHLPPEEIPDLWLVCDFEHMLLTHRSVNKKWRFKTGELRRHIRKFADIAGYATGRVTDDQEEVNVRAAEKMARLHDALKASGYDGHALEVYLVRLLFCLFADDTGIFPKDIFLGYVESSKTDGGDLSHRIADLFEVLNMPEDARAKRIRLADELRQFRYINGGLFAERLAPADFDAKMRQTLIDCARFDWSAISPAIFGAMFQGVMDEKQRREFGAHYTSEENIAKLINPLFMDDLWKEFERVKTSQKALEQFHERISRLKFLDPACGCGNFLIITYRELRRLELEILKMRLGGSQKALDLDYLALHLKVNVGQFYGIECEEFPCQIAQVGMWLIDHQMNLCVSELFGAYYARLPLTQGAAIVHANALRIDWESVVPKAELRYILGNPPFNGARTMTATQKTDMTHVFGGLKGAGNLDYVTAWYKKSADLTRETNIRCAFVSTNSVAQGEQPAILWKPLMENGARINFGVPTFKWSNEAKGKAAVHCVIIGFSHVQTKANINPYLLEAPTVFIESRQRPICDVPEIGMGNQPIDDGNYLFAEEEKNDFLKREPQAEKWFRPWMGADEFINGYKRYCLWLGKCPPDELRKMPEVMKRVEAVKKFRQASKRRSTQKLADTPTQFQTENMPSKNYIVLPEVSSERRKYIPMGFLSKETLCSNKLRLMPGGAPYHFGILMSNVHMAWVRAVCGRLKSDYSYSINIVYNNFPWPESDDAQKAKIEKLAQDILDARARFPESSLADLYDPLSMPPELLKAHQANDRAVMKLYGFPAKDTEAAIVARLMALYQALTKA